MEKLLNMQINAFARLGVLLSLLAGLTLGCSGNQTSQQQPSSGTAAEPTPSTPAPAASQSAPPSSSFSKTLSLQGVTFDIKAANGRLTVTPSGLERGEPFTQDIEGTVTGAEIEDLNSNGSPEVVVFTSSGAEAYGNAYGFSALGKSSMVQLYLPDIRNNAEASQGYMGHDEFALVETSLVRRFPIYANGSPTGKTRQIQYKMVPGENMPVFQIDKITEY